MTQMTLFSNGAVIPAYLQDANDSATDSLAGSSSQFKRISIKGGVWRMIVNGKEIAKNEERAMNIIVVAAAPENSRTFYDSVYVDGAALRPTCSSADGKKPDSNIENPQALTCLQCPQNIAGSGPNGSRACRYSRRLAVILENDMHTEAEVYQLVVPAQSLFGAGENGKLPLTTYAQFLKANNVRITGVVTEARFDTNSPTPKLTFRAIRPLTEEEYFLAKEKGKSQEALNAINFDPASMDLGGVTSKPAQEVVRERPAPIAAPQPKPAAPRATRASEEIDIVSFVEEEEKATVAEPVKRETKKTQADSPDLASLLDEWED